MKPLPPGSAIGLLGGGQLARMLVQAGHAMDFRFVALDPTGDCPASLAGASQLTAPFDDPQALEILARRCCCVTYEFENIPYAAAEFLESKTALPQSSALLQTCQHRLREKTALKALGIPVAPFARISSVEELEDFYAEQGPLMLKTATGGYDGKGQAGVVDRAKCKTAFETLRHSGGDLMAERLIAFDSEASVVAARNAKGDVRCYAPTENFHRKGILAFSRIPAALNVSVQKQAVEIAKRIAQGLQVVGVFAVELFIGPGEHILVNELAPRPHNSGHWTMDGAATSQFEQHLRAVAGWPLGDCRALAPVVMLNVLGEHLPALLTALSRLPSSAHLHLYGKAHPAPGRKMGHVNFVMEDDDLPSLAATLQSLRIWDNETLERLHAS